MCLGKCVYFLLEIGPWYDDSSSGIRDGCRFELHPYNYVSRVNHFTSLCLMYKMDIQLLPRVVVSKKKKNYLGESLDWSPAGHKCLLNIKPPHPH